MNNELLYLLFLIKLTLVSLLSITVCCVNSDQRALQLTVLDSSLLYLATAL